MPTLLKDFILPLCNNISMVIKNMDNNTDTNKAKKLSHPTLMPQRIYKFRILGMALAGLPIAVVLKELHAPIYSWLWWIFVCYLWPHIAYIIAKNSKQPYIAERNNLIFDSFIAGSWIPLLHFNLLPSVLLPSITLADKLASGIKNLWLYSLPFILSAAILFSFFTGFAFHPNTSMPVILACLPILAIHTLLVSIGSYQLVRSVQFQNIKFSKLSQQDSLTTLYTRRYWQEKVNSLMQQCKENGAVASMLFIDIDHFKEINDKYGHSIGDDILLAITKIIQDTIPNTAIAGRFGGDEFAIALPLKHSAARSLAKQISQQTNEIQIKTANQLNCTVSIGISELSKNQTTLRNWIEAADKSLYKAKNMGRNQVI